MREKALGVSILAEAMYTLAHSDEMPVPAPYGDHALKGGWTGYRECHVGGRKSDWLLIYRLPGDGTITYTRIRTHDDLLG